MRQSEGCDASVECLIDSSTQVSVSVNETGATIRVKHRSIIAMPINERSRAIRVRFVVRADEKLTVFLELEAAVRACAELS